jgi:hypothetical protein
VKTSFVTACLAAPAVAAALLIGGVEIYRVVRPGAPLFGDPPPASLADGLARRFPVEQLYGFLRSGQDPNAPVPVADSDYTGGSTAMVAPLMLAVAARDDSAVQMLLNFGVRLDLPQNRNAICLARALGDEGIAELLEEAGMAAAACAPPKADAATPLLAWME